MSKEKDKYFVELVNEAEKNGGKIHIPKNPPKSTTPAETDELLNMPDNFKNNVFSYLSIVNESGGALVPYIIAEIGKLQEKSGQEINFFEILDRMTHKEPQALALLNRAREQLKKAQILEAPESKLTKPTPTIKTYGLQNDAVNNDLICSEFLSREIDGQMYMVFDTNQAGKNAEPVKVITALSYEGPQPLSSRKISGYDRSIYNAVSTLYHYHQIKYEGDSCIITPQEIWRTMNGITDKSKKPSPAQLKKVCSSIDKMRFTRIILDISEELQKHKIVINDERLTGGLIDTYYLKADRGHFLTENGRVIDAYKIENEPILYTYNQAKKRVIYIPFDLLNTAEAISIGTAGNEGHTIEIREYLLYQIMLMYNKERKSKRILFKTMYEKTGIEPPEQRIDRAKYANENAYRTGIKKEAAKDREKVFEILEAWKIKKFIKGYKRAGTRPIIGADILLMPNPPQATPL